MKGSVAISLAIAVLLSMNGPGAAAGERYLGAYNSLKGLGLSAAFKSADGTAMTFVNLYADMFGVFSGRTGDVGIAASCTREYVIAYADFGYSYLALHAGPGVFAGYVHDYERHFFSSEGQTYKKMGFVAALSGNIGLTADFFNHRLSVDLSLCVNPGVHIRKDRESDALLLALYKRGLYYCLTPQLCLYYRF